MELSLNKWQLKVLRYGKVLALFPKYKTIEITFNTRPKTTFSWDVNSSLGYL